MSSSDESEDEKGVFRKFDEEASLIIQTETLPKKSGERYLLVYETYKNWKIQNEKSLSSSEEKNLVVYFTELKAKLKPPTLWSIWSMLKKTLSTKDNIDISGFLNLKALLKNNNKPKQSLTLKWSDVEKFIKEAPDQVYLASKVILVFGICGGLRCEELTNLKIENVTEKGNRFIISVLRTKTHHSQEFIIGELFYQIVKKYISLRPQQKFTDRFFIQYKEGKCIHQVIGINKIGETPYTIATYLALENAKGYTFHCFRRTAAALLSESGANMQLIKQKRGWRSDNVAQLYIEHSKNNRQKLFEGITHAAQLPNTSSEINPKPSTSKEALEDIPTENESSLLYRLSWDDFSENFDSNEPQQLIRMNEIADCDTENRGKVPQSKSLSTSKKLFHSHPPVKVDFIRPTEPPNKKKKDSLEDQRDNHLINQSSIEYGNCTFNNCTFSNCTFSNCSFTF